MLVFRVGWSLLGRMDRWVTCDFTWFPTACLSYHDDGRVIMKGGCAMKPSLGLKKISPQAGIESGTARSTGQRLTYLATCTGDPSTETKGNTQLTELLALIVNILAKRS